MISRLEASMHGAGHVKALDAIIVGAGFAGLYMLHSLRNLGLNAEIIEQGRSIGGTWYWNRYPGARCDSESEYYCYSFSKVLQEKWNWKEKYPTQPEILQYLNYAADELDLRPHIRLNRRLVRAFYDKETSRWTASTDGDETFRVKYIVLAVGCLSQPSYPHIEGLDRFEGEWYHTSNWPEGGVNFAGKRVAVMGTGSTGVQVIPIVAAQARELLVLQRTPGFVLPARNAAMDPEYMAWVKRNYSSLWDKARQSELGLPYSKDPRSACDVTPEEREQLYQHLWDAGGLKFLRKSFRDFITNPESNRTIVDFVHRKIDEIVEDPVVAEKLKPKDYPIGTKRACAGEGYYETFNRDNVTLVDVRKNQIKRLTRDGIEVGDKEYPIDAIVFATGFDAMTGAIRRIDIRGRNDMSLSEKWDAGPRTYLGIMSAGFPNLFITAGPQSPSVLSNMPTSIEQSVEWISDAIAMMERSGSKELEPTNLAENGWVETCRELADKTLYPKANSWYMGANIPGKPRVFMVYVGGVGQYRRLCEDIKNNNYEGFKIQ